LRGDSMGRIEPNAYRIALVSNTGGITRLRRAVRS
jgi:hypothetical protein